jgi:hypothetical protein
VLILWWLRRRPLAFGAVLAVGFLHREFVILSVPALALAESGDRSCWSRDTFRRIGLIAFGFFVVYLLVDDLKLHLSGGPLALQAASLRGQMCLGGPWLPRVRSLVTDAVPALLGGAPIPLQQIRMNTPLVTGYTPLGWLVGAALFVMAARVATVRRQEPDAGPGASFGAYLAWVGFFTACVYPLSCNVIPGAPPILRYLLLALLLPVGLGAVFFRREPSAGLRAALAGVFVAWAAVNLFEQVRLIRATVASPPANEYRILTDYLIAHRIRYARATYWDAYVVDFLSRERVIVASLDVFRIEDYQRQVEEHAAGAVLLERFPCEGGDRVASWCVKR